jgi:hypothetical protein
LLQFTGYRDHTVIYRCLHRRKILGCLSHFGGQICVAGVAAMGYGAVALAG